MKDIKYIDEEIDLYKKRKSKNNVKTTELKNIVNKTMSRELNFIEVHIRGNKLKALVDNGSTNSLITKSAYDKYFSHCEKRPCNLTMYTAGSVLHNNVIAVTQLCYYHLDIANNLIEVCGEFLIANNINNNSMIIGANLLNDPKISIKTTPVTWVVRDDEISKTIFLQKGFIQFAQFQKGNKTKLIVRRYSELHKIISQYIFIKNI